MAIGLVTGGPAGMAIGGALALLSLALEEYRDEILAWLQRELLAAGVPPDEAAEIVLVASNATTAAEFLSALKRNPAKAGRLGRELLSAVTGGGGKSKTGSGGSSKNPFSTSGARGGAKQGHSMAPEKKSTRCGAGKTYQTYTKDGPNGVYSGRTRGTGTPEQNVANRDRSHHKNKEGYGPAVLDKSSSSEDAIRGREEKLIEGNGGARSAGGTSGNAIRGISPTNPKRERYLKAAEKEFGG